MDRNTITGIVLIFAIFIGFSIYNNSRNTRAYENTVQIAESHYAKGELEAARTEYINAMRFKPNQPDLIEKINQINLKLGNVPETHKTDTVITRQPKTETPLTNTPGVPKDIGQYGVFAQAATVRLERVHL